jgi:hypothetical protein
MEREYRIIEPEVAGGFGEGAVLDHSTTPLTVEKLHYEFEGWLGDDLLTTTPCFIVTSPLKESLIQFNGTGYSFDEVMVSKSKSFRRRCPKVVLPSFAWLTIHGQPGRDDAGLGRYSALVVSDEFLNVLKKHNISNCIVRKRRYRQPKNLP